ncbi:MAG: hypothetical protein AAF624_02320 [Bacteroidota bacterium]
MTYRARRATSGTHLFAMPAVFALLLALGLLLTGCDSAEASTDGVATETVTLASAVTGVASDAGASSDDLVSASRSFEGRHLEPGMLWTIAAEVHSRLTPEQIERLEAKLDERRTALEDRRAELGDRPRGPRGGPGGGPGGPGGPGGAAFDRVLTDDLALSDAQTDAIGAIRDAYRAEFEVLRESDLADEDRRAQAQALVEAMKAEIGAVLTEAQIAALEAHRAEREAEREERRAAEQAAMAEALALTDAQQADFDAFRAEMEAQRGTVDPKEVREALQAAIAEILDDTQEEIVTVCAALRVHLLQGGPGGRGPRGPGGPGGRG